MGSALLIIDMISDWQFPDGDILLPNAAASADAIAQLKRRCRCAGLPVIYVNDHFGNWHAAFAGQVEHSLASLGRSITERLLPTAEDYFVLKPQHSAFFLTPLEMLLRQLEIDSVLLTGVAGDQCILATAADAKMRSLQVSVASDGIASQTVERNTCAIQLMRRSFKMTVEPGDALSLTGGS